MGRYDRECDLDSWLSDPRIAERGFAHRWTSRVAAGNGEDAFLTLLDQHMAPALDVADLGCGHGELTLDLATRCRSVVGLERNTGYVRLARELIAERGATNIEVFQVDLAGHDDAGRPFAPIPLGDDCVDLFVNRRGPILARYLSEALRVARSGAAIVGLHPAGGIPRPGWVAELPDPFRSAFGALSRESVIGWVTDPLEAAGIADYNLWWIDVPEFLRTPEELHARLVGSQDPPPPPYPDVADVFGRVFRKHASTGGVTIRHQRLLWRASLS